MAFRVLFSPQREKERWHCAQDGFGAMHLGMAAWAQRDHELELRSFRHAVMNDDAALPCSGRVADTAAIAITLQHRFPQTTEVFLILAPERVAG